MVDKPILSHDDRRSAAVRVSALLQAHDDDALAHYRRIHLEGLEIGLEELAMLRSMAELVATALLEGEREQLAVLSALRKAIAQQRGLAAFRGRAGTADEADAATERELPLDPETSPRPHADPELGAKPGWPTTAPEPDQLVPPTVAMSSFSGPKTLFSGEEATAVISLGGDPDGDTLEEVAATLASPRPAAPVEPPPLRLDPDGETLASPGENSGPALPFDDPTSGSRGGNRH